MAALTLTATQSAFMTSLEQPFLNAFGDGVVLPGGSPGTIPGFKGFKDYDAATKLSALNGIKSTFAPLVSLIIKDEVVNTVTTFTNGFGIWGDGNYGNGVMRYYKDGSGYVRLHGLMRTPASGQTYYLAAFNLPAGYRPAAGDNHIFSCVSNDSFCSVEVNSSGNVLLRTAVSNDTWVSLECRFLAGG